MDYGNVGFLADGNCKMRQQIEWHSKESENETVKRLELLGLGMRVHVLLQFVEFKCR